MVTEENPLATMSTPSKLRRMNAPAKPARIRLTRRWPAYWRVTIDDPPINVVGPEMVKQFQEVINALLRPTSKSGSWSSTARRVLPE